MLGFTGTFEGKPISVQSSAWAARRAAIVIEELVQLGVKRFVRVGTCGGLQPDMQLGDLILAITAVASRRTVDDIVGGEPHAPTADFELVHGAVHPAKHIGQPVRVGPFVSSDVFYNPDAGQYAALVDRGVLAVEMEAAVLFTIGALRACRPAACSRSRDVVVEGEFMRITDDELRAAVDRMTELALATVTETISDRHRLHRQPGVGQRRDRQALAARSRRRAAERGARAATRSSRTDPGHLDELAREAADAGAELLVAVGGDGTVNEVVNGCRGAQGARSSPSSPAAPAATSSARTASRRSSTRARRRARGRDARDRPRPRDLPLVERARPRRALREHRVRRHDRRDRGAREQTTKTLGGKVVPPRDVHGVRGWQRATSASRSTTSSAAGECTTYLANGRISAAASRSARRPSPTTACSTCSSSATSPSPTSRSRCRRCTAASICRIRRRRSCAE